MTAPTATRDADATARDHLWVRAPTVRAAATVAEAREAAAASGSRQFVYALDEQKRLVGTLPITQRPALAWPDAAAAPARRRTSPGSCPGGSTRREPT